MEQQPKELTGELPRVFRLRHASTGRRQHGVALVIVLGFLVLLTVLIVAFFTSVTSEYSAAKTYAAGASTRFLSESAINLVMAQIAKGTQGQQAGTIVIAIVQFWPVEIGDAERREQVFCRKCAGIHAGAFG